MKSKWILACALLSAAACESVAPRPLLQGSDFAGWKAPVGAQAAHWTLRDARLACEGPAAPIWTEREFGDCEITLDVRLIEGRPTAVLLARGAQGFQIALEPKPTGEWSHIKVRFTGDKNDVSIDGQLSAGLLPGVAKQGAVGLSVEGLGSVEFARVAVLEEQ
jgi:hypothetical protein